MKATSLPLLQALNAAAAVLQHTSHSEAEVLNACRDEIARLGFRGGLSLLDETGECLVVKTTVQPKWITHILADLEKRTGYKSKNYSFPVAQVSVYRQAVEARKGVFTSDSSLTVSQMLPASVRPIAGIIIKALGTPPRHLCAADQPGSHDRRAEYCGQRIDARGCAGRRSFCESYRYCAGECQIVPRGVRQRATLSHVSRCCF